MEEGMSMGDLSARMFNILDNGPPNRLYIEVDQEVSDSDLECYVAAGVTEETWGSAEEALKATNKPIFRVLIRRIR